MWSINMQHFLDKKGSTDQTPVKARELADHFGAIVAVVTLDFTDCDDSGVITGWNGTLWDCTEVALDGL